MPGSVYVAPGMRELRRSGDDIADGVDAGFAGALEGVDLDEAAIELHAGAFESNIFGVGLAAHGDEQRVGLHGFAFAVRKGSGETHASGGSLNAFHFGSGFDADAAFLEAAFEFLGDFLVLHGNDAREHFENGDFRSEAVEAGGEFDADGSGTENGQRFRDLAQVQDFNVRENALRIGLKAREHAGLRTRGEDDVLGLDDFLFARGRGDFDLAGAGEASAAEDPLDLVLLHQELDALGVLGDDLILTIADAAEIEARVIAEDAFLIGV